MKILSNNNLNINLDNSSKSLRKSNLFEVTLNYVKKLS